MIGWGCSPWGGVAMGYEWRHLLDEPAPEPYDPMSQYARQVRGE